MAYPREFCRGANIKCTDLASLSTSLPKLCVNELTKRVVLELCNYCNAEDYSWDDLYAWLCHLITDQSLLPLPTIKVKISRMHNSLIKLKRNEQYDNIPIVLNQPFITIPPASSRSVSTNISGVDHRLAQEFQAENDSKDAKIAELTSKVKKMSVRNVNKRIRHRNVQISQLKERAKQKSMLEARLEHIVKQAESKVTLC